MLMTFLERNCKGLESFVESFKGAFATDGVAKEDREKIDDDVSPETPPRKAHALVHGFEDSLLLQMPSQEYHLSKP